MSRSRPSGLCFPPGFRLSIPSPIQWDRSRPVSPGCPTASDFDLPERPPRQPRTRSKTLPVSCGSPRLMNEPDNAAAGPVQPFSPPVIPRGTYVAFAFAADASHPEESGGVTSCPTHRYIGLVTDAINSVNEEGVRETREITVSYVARRAPSDSWGVCDDHWLPISPESEDKVDGPIRPLETTVLFPYVGTKQWTTVGARLRVAQLHKSSLSFCLRDEELGRFEDITTAHLEDLTEAMSQHSGEDEIPDMILIPHQGVLADIWTDVRLAGGVNDPSEFLEGVSESGW
ncbi:hypothetical protein GLOTRDRAFT_129985 [Gloeophyllum trabeum ATCC 11539]|uniref:Uncharacterized protein n=1 Tax=Gloeophyllum trabeum (strain ATCC 11539 / FP-39264 / Madison 617) TaxID=670483 RepID=S7Q546_GLOTA|nr:uncharacterized protein GLOTRDRAFT_129985 [Gloeophyllum trabeum ATCC 11539]EPQ54632.1 hypothetical protein GLOTRDRAFT_129985 [Gloeophyllum trabeum ATCC 11539]